MKSLLTQTTKQVHIFLGICAFFIYPVAFAEDKPAPTLLTNNNLPSTSGSIFTMLFGLCVVLGIMAGIAWLIKRSGLTNTNNRNGLQMKVVGGISIGTRERVIVVEVDNQWLVLGVTPSTINTLASLPKQELKETNDVSSTPSFSSWLKQTIEKRK